MANVKELTNGDFSEFISGQGLKVVDFFAEWCMPCVMMAPVFESLSESDENSSVGFAKVNVEDGRDLAVEHQVSGIPCIVFFKEGKEVDRVVGGVNEEILQEKINENK